MSTAKLANHVQESNNQKRSTQRKLGRSYQMVYTAMFAALASVLMFYSISVPLMPSFIKLDISELPAVLASYMMGPVCGVVVCLVKNLVNALSTQSFGVGEVCNFLLGVAFVVPAGFLYQRKKTFSMGVISALVGCVSMAVLSVPLNYYIVYPAYELFMPREIILEAYQAINPNVKTLLQALVMFNMPFTFVKGLLNVVLTFLMYKPFMLIARSFRH